MAEEYRIGAKVAQIRESRTMSRQELAARAGIEVELVDQIESGRFIPSLSPLIRIARVLGVRLGTFLDDQGNSGPVVTRADGRRKVMRFSGKSHAAGSDLDFFALAAGKHGRHMEPFAIDLHPSSAQEIALSAHEGEEFIHVLSGEVEVAYGKETYRLTPGDSVYYDSIVPHNVHCAGEADARILAVVYAPI